MEHSHPDHLLACLQLPRMDPYVIGGGGGNFGHPDGPQLYLNESRTEFKTFFWDKVKGFFFPPPPHLCPIGEIFLPRKRGIPSKVQKSLVVTRATVSIEKLAPLLLFWGQAKMCHFLSPSMSIVNKNKTKRKGESPEQQHRQQEKQHYKHILTPHYYKDQFWTTSTDPTE